MNRSCPEHPACDILLVEDNPTDAYLVGEAFKEISWLGRLHVAKNGDEALEFLRQEDSGLPLPGLVLLDLNLPGTDGREVLKQIKSDQTLKRIPVVVLSSSQSDDDRLACYNLHANAFMTKALDLDELHRLARALTDYWFGVVKLPPQ